MNMQRLVIGLTVTNLVLLLLLVTQAGRTAAQSDTSILRGSALELVDDGGRIRSRFDGEESGEVVLRLFDSNGTIRVKLGAGTDGSGLLLADETKEVGIHLISRRTGTSERPNTTSITMRGAEGQERVFRPEQP
jgi:hypothetical protein